MKKLFFLLLFVPMLGVAQLAGFSGKWSLNTKKTEFKQVPEYVLAVSLEVKQKKDMLVAQYKMYDKEGTQHYYEQSMRFDGKMEEVLLYNDERKQVTMRQGSNESSFLLSVRVIDAGNPAGRTYTETWSLEDGGKTLVVDRVAPLADEYSIKAYYSKK